MPTSTLDKSGGEMLWEEQGSPLGEGQDGSRDSRMCPQFRKRRQRLAPQLQGSLLLASSMGNL